MIELGAVRLAEAPARPRMMGPADEEAVKELEIVSTVHTVAAALASGITHLKEDFERATFGEPIPFMSDATQAEKMVAISDAAQEMAAIASSVLEGALAPYVDRNDYHTISIDIQRALKLGRDARERIGSEPFRPQMQGPAEEFFLFHVQDVRDLRDAAQQLVVVAGNGEVPVREPGEHYAAIATGTLVAVGALVVGGLVWAAVS